MSEVKVPTDLSAKNIFENILPEFLEKDKTLAKKINTVLAIDLAGEEGGQWSADFSSDNPSVIRGIAENAKCVICMHVDVFNDLVAQRRIRPWLSAFIKKRLTVKGHLPTALRLRNLAMVFDKSRSYD